MKWLFLLLAAGCSVKPPAPQASSIELDYERGGKQHSFRASVAGEMARVELRDRAATKQASIEKAKYLELLGHAESVVESPSLRSLASCRSPFVLKVSRETDTKKVEGCRTSDEAAALGRLIRDAEFLLISKD